MFTTTFTLDRHIEELRAELRTTIDPNEAHRIRIELEAALMARKGQLFEAAAKA